MQITFFANKNQEFLTHEVRILSQSSKITFLVWISSIFTLSKYYSYYTNTNSEYNKFLIKESTTFLRIPFLYLNEFHHSFFIFIISPVVLTAS